MIKSNYLNIRNKLFSDITDIPDILEKKYFKFLDGMRGFAIITVLLCHLSWNKKWGNYIDKSLGVDIFFILSGFLITTLLLKEQVYAGKVSLKKFYARRVLRIFPVAYLFILVLIIINLIFHLGISYKSFLAAIFYLKNFPITGDWYSGHYWTLAVEEQFYIIAPIILLSGIKNYLRFMAVLFVIVPIAEYLVNATIGITYTSNHDFYVISYCFLHTFVHIFSSATLKILAGSLLSILIFKGCFNLNKLNSNYYLSFILFILACLAHFASNNLLVFPQFIFTILLCFVIALNLQAPNFLTTLLNNEVLVMIGILSYSIYVWQQLFTHLQPWAGMFKYADSTFLNMVALFLVAYLSYTFYEKPFLKFKNKNFGYKSLD